MSHELINTQTGAVGFAYNKNNTTQGAPWHGLGTPVDGQMNAADALRLGGLDFRVEKARNQFQAIGNGIVDAPSFTTYRTDTHQALGTVGERYKIVQNVDALEMFDALADRGECIYDTAGAVRNGALTFLLAKIPGLCLLGKPDEEINNYLLLMNSHDGSSGIVATLTPIRVVCNNTLQAALQTGSRFPSQHRFAFRHTANAQNNLRQAAHIIEVSTRETEKAKAMWEAMMKVRVTDQWVDSLIESIYPSTDQEVSTRTKNIREALREYYHTGPGQAANVGTLWGAHQAVSGYLTNVASYKDDDSRFTSLTQGGAYHKMTKAHGLALKALEA